MESTCIVDCGRHTTKYAVLSKRNRKGVEVQVKEWRAEVTNDDDTADALARRCIPAILNDQLTEGEDLTLVLLLDTLVPPRVKASLMYTCFEQFGCHKASLHYTSCTALYASGETSGIAVDVGFNGVRITPVLNGVPQTVLSADLSSVGSRKVDAALSALLPCSPSDDLLRSVKERYCFLNQPESDLAAMVLPDGSVFTPPFSVEEVRVAAQSLLYSSVASVPDTLRYTLQKCCSIYSQPKNWLRFGGASRMSGVGDILSSAIQSPLSGSPLQELNLRSYTHAPVSGAMILSQLNIFKSICVDVADYEEDGPDRCVHLQVVDAR